MRYAILGDIHGNLEALEAALNVLRPAGIDVYLQVGDIVGYGADPGPCIQKMREIGALVVSGNHDWAVVGKLDTSYFNPFAREAVEWTRSILEPADRLYLEQLPLVLEINDELEVVHATRDQPELFDYIQTYYDAHRSFEALSTNVCFMGHSHIPISFIKGEAVTHTLSTSFQVPKDARALINVGSVGQPRDDNPKTAFAVYDSRTREYALHRVAYDAKRTAEKIRRAGLPDILGERLLFGR